MSVDLDERLAAMKDRVAEVESRIAEACRRSARPRESVQLIAVTKTFPSAVIEQAYDLGLRHFGENYVQEFQAKKAQLPALEGAAFHLIGRLQSNKSALAASLFDVIHTLDTAKLARRLDSTPQPLQVFVEVKLGEEESKSGVAPAELPEFLDTVRCLPSLHLEGLMVIPPWSENAETSRPYFAELRDLAAKHGLAKLSMGMSNDFEVAIEEGTTHVRVGTALFGRRAKAA